MKKLMITVCAIAFAAVTQASTYNWQSNSGWFCPKDSEDDLVGVVYVFDANQVSMDSVLAALSTTGDWAQYFTPANDDTPYMNTQALQYGMWNMSGDREVAAGAGKGITGNGTDTAASAFFVILDDSVASAQNYWISDEAMVKDITGDVKDGGNLYFNPGDTEVKWSKLATAAPEPTSGLLLLLGVAGLALRRRRA